MRRFSGTPCYSNNLACHPAVGDMRSVLRLKIQNAINSAILAESEDRGIFVGGRRRNRKKKRTKHGEVKLTEIPSCIFKYEIYFVDGVVTAYMYSTLQFEHININMISVYI